MLKVLYIIFFIIFIIVGICSILVTLKNIKIRKFIKKNLKQQKIISNNIEFDEYFKKKLPYTGLTINFDNLYDKSDTKKLRKLKELYIINMKKAHKLFLIELVIIICWNIILIF